MDKSKYKKLEMLIFAGENLESWAYRAKHFFEIHELSEVEKVKVPVVSFTEDEVNWFCWSHTHSPITTLEELKKRMHV